MLFRPRAPGAAPPFLQPISPVPPAHQNPVRPLHNCQWFCAITHARPPLSPQAAIYFGNDYVSLPEWFSLGFIYGVLSLVIVIGLGWPGWKFLGWY